MSSGVTTQSLAQSLEAFILNARVAGRARKTIQIYRRAIEPLIASLEDPDLETITPGDLRRYLAQLQERLSPVTVSMRWRAI